MPLFHLFTWDMRTEGLFVVWAAVLLVGLALFKSRDAVKEVIQEALQIEPESEAPLVVITPTRARYLPSFTGYGLQGA
jgi:hypothetical protein